MCATAGAQDDVTWFNTRNGLLADYVKDYAICADSQNRIWVGHDSGLSCYDNSMWTTYTDADGLLPKQIFSVAADREDGVWFGTVGGIHSYHDGEFTFYPLISDEYPVTYIVYSIAADSENVLWLGTQYGVVTFVDGAVRDVFTDANSGLYNNYINSLALDHLDRKWFVSDSPFDNSITLLQDGEWTVFNYKQGVVSHQLYSIIETPSHEMWVTTDSNILAFDGVFWSAKGSMSYKDLAPAPDGLVWTSLARYYDGTSWNIHPAADQFTSFPSAVTVDHNNNVWIGTKGQGVMRIGDYITNVEGDAILEPIQLGNYPNPFNASTAITFTLPDSAPVRVSLYSLSGQLVRSLFDDRAEAGTHTVTWDGSDSQGRPVSTGTYIVRMDGSYTATRKVMLLK